MILSIRHGFIYFAMAKTATASIEFWLGRYGDITLLRAEKGKHLACADVRQRYAELFRRYYPYETFFRFGVIREPVSWVLSWYNFRSRTLLADPADPRHQYYTGAYTFDQFVEELVSANPRPFARIGTQRAFYDIASGEVGVAALARYEHLSSDLAKIRRYLPVDLLTGLSGKRRNESPVRLRLSEVSSTTHARIREAMRDDIELYEIAPATLLRNAPRWDSTLVPSALAFLRREYRADRRETFFNKWLSTRHASWRS